MYNRKQNRLRWRRQHAANDRQARFITGYVSVTHPEVYGEAIEFRNKLREKYPQKMDLRRVYEFSQLLPKKTRVSFTDNLELRIPLMSSIQDTPSTTSTPCTTSVPEATSTPCTTSVAEANQSDEVTTLVAEPNQSGEIPLLDDSTMEQLIEELQNDPQLTTFFDDMDIDINIPDMSPLEKELFNGKF